MKKIIFFFVFLTFSNPSISDSKLELGSEIYKNKAQCGVCHTLKVAGSVSNIGPNLDQLKAQLEQIVYVVTNGRGVMPSFKGTLTLEEIEAVAHYVFNGTNK